MYSFAEKKHSQRGLVSTILGSISLVIFLVLAYLAYYLDGQGGAWFGSIGFTGAVFALMGVVLGLKSFGEENTLFLFSKIGSILNGCVLAIWIFVILIGVS
jgi:membrane associated rhomboid family serine protease